MSRSLDDLDDMLKPMVFELLARLIDARIPVYIIDTLRTLEEHEANLAKGVSWTKRSRHLPNAKGKSEAIDIAPVLIFQLRGSNKLQWDKADPVWLRIGGIGAKVGFTGKWWGGNWNVKDMGHFELPIVAPQVVA